MNRSEKAFIKLLHSAPVRRSIALGIPLCAAALSAGIYIGRMNAHVLWAVPAALLALLAAFLLQDTKRVWGIAAFACALGCLLGWQAWHPDMPEPGEHFITGIICDEIPFRETDKHASTRLGYVRVDGLPAGDAYWSWYGDLPEGLEPGSAITFSGRIYEPSAESNPNGFDFQSYIYGKGMRFCIYGMNDAVVGRRFSVGGGFAKLRHVLADRLVNAMGEDAGGFIAAMLLGTRSMVDAEERAAFAKVGAAHVLSVSGFHVSILAGLVLLLLRRCTEKTRLIVISLVLAFYAALTGGNAPVIRASLLTVIGLVRHLTRRKTHPLWSLMSVYILLLLVNPAQLLSCGFQMTFWAVAGISLGSPALMKAPVIRRMPLKFRQAVCATLSAQLGLLFPMLTWYHEVQILGMFLNLLIIPLASLIISLGWGVLLLTVWMPAAVIIGQAPAGLYQAMTWTVQQLANWPFCSLWTAAGNLFTLIGCLLLLYGVGPARWESHQRMLGCLTAGLLITALSVFPWPHHGTEYIQLSVGSADAAVLWDENTVTVIDTGEAQSDLSSWLHARRLTVDRLVITHLHSDHAGGIRDLLDDGIPVRELILPVEAENLHIHPDVLALVEELRAKGTVITHASRGDHFATPNASFRVLFPEEGRIRQRTEANLYSLVMLADVRGTTMLLTGDLDGQYEMYTAVPADILKAAHHGSAHSTSEAYLAAVAPQTILVSCGDAAREAAMAEKAGDAAYYCTRTRGAIHMTFDEDAYAVSTYR